MVAAAGRSAQASEPGFSFAFGYSLGQANQFRNRLPAPPYFSIYPPVYYGERHERPYGESPYASWPLLQASSDYQARPKQAPVQFVNPHVPAATPCASCGQGVVEASPAEMGKMVTIVNPFVVPNASVVANEASK